MSIKLKVFVASSSEAKKQDIYVRQILEEYNIDPISWRNVFHPGEFGLESLINVSEEIDGAIIITTPDDKIWYRGSESLAPRDNILFEMGLFIKALGRKNVAVILYEGNNKGLPKVPTDLAGLNLIYFKENKEAINENTLLKWINKFKRNLNYSHYNFDNVINILKNNYGSIPESWKDEIKNYILSPFKIMSISALQGEFSLNASQYYESLFTQLKIAKKGTIIRAISLVSTELWTDDSHQKRFYDYNVMAIKNGTNIKRLFVAPQEQISNYWSLMQNQMDDGIEIRTINPKLFSEYNNLYDSILFEHDSLLRSYVSTQFYDNPGRLKGAKLFLNHTYCKEQINSFDSLWAIARTPKPKVVIPKSNLNNPPGLELEHHFLEKEVTTCEEAASARKIPLQNELKSLILETPSNLVVVHLPGDGRISLRAIKNYLEINDISIADPETIAKIGLLPGTVSAVLNPVWGMTHLISKQLLSLDYVMTNDGTKSGYFSFDPVILTSAKISIIGNFEK